MSGPSIPERTSSKRFLELEKQVQDIEAEADRKKRKLNPKSSFDVGYWVDSSHITALLKRKAELQRQISLEEFKARGGTEADWKKTEAAEKLLLQLKAETVKEGIYKKQAEQLGRDTSSALRRSYINIFTTSKRGLGILSTGAGKRGTRTQSIFRKELVEAYNARNAEDPQLASALWCPVLGKWLHKDYTTAAHIFAYMHGQETMDAIFGRTEKPELFSTRNGLILSTAVEKKFDDGFLVIVPNLPDNPTLAQTTLWRQSEPKEFKVRLIDLSHPEVGTFVDLEKSRTWKDLDGTKLQFRSPHRPRARYLYFHYCLQILRRSWAQSEKGEALKEHMGHHYWGTPGKYIRKQMLLAFIEEVGHQHVDLLSGAAEDDTEDEGQGNQDADVPDPGLLDTLANQVLAKANDEDEDDDEDEEEDE